jgi:hypothetical protein
MNHELENLSDQTKHLSPEDRLQSIGNIDRSNKQKPEKNPWLATAGSLSEDPFFDDYVAEIERYRQELDREVASHEDDCDRSKPWHNSRSNHI